MSDFLSRVGQIPGMHSLNFLPQFQKHMMKPFMMQLASRTSMR